LAAKFYRATGGGKVGPDPHEEPSPRTEIQTSAQLTPTLYYILIIETSFMTG